MPYNEQNTVPNIPQHSEELEGMLGKPPGWILHSGIGIIFWVVLILIILTGIIKYPDKIEANVIIRSENPPIDLLAQRSGRIHSILVQDGEEVTEGQILMVMQNPANWEEVVDIEDWFALLDGMEVDFSVLASDFPENLELGELQPSYSGLVEQLKDYQYFMKRNGIARQIKSLGAEVYRMKKLGKTYQYQERLYFKELKLFEKDLLRNKKLKEGGVISTLAMEEKEKQIIQFKRQLSSTKTTRIQNDIRIGQLKQQIRGLKKEWKKEIHSRELNIKKQIDQFRALIESWKQQVLTVAPINGKVSLSGVLAKGQTIQAGQVIGAVLPPEGVGRIIAIGNTPSTGIGKIALGTPVQIDLDAYPSREFGQLNSFLQHIAQLPKQDAQSGNWLYEIKMNLPDTLLTTYQKPIPFKQNLTGKAILLTKDKRIIDRIFENVLNLINNRSL